MTEITIKDPSEGVTYSGYWSIEIVEEGDVVAETHLSPDMLPDIDDTTDLRRFVEEYADVLRKFEDAGL
ncbi:hypothetical protein [Halobaculum sp. EA56]|uniref:hypothetical protein n=1 Tax=Halobaculum sp. EA56 TaxID=3421648 RepID=UPI003EC13F16